MYQIFMICQFVLSDDAKLFAIWLSKQHFYKLTKHNRFIKNLQRTDSSFGSTIIRVDVFSCDCVHMARVHDNSQNNKLVHLASYLNVAHIYLSLDLVFSCYRTRI